MTDSDFCYNKIDPAEDEDHRMGAGLQRDCYGSLSVSGVRMHGNTVAQHASGEVRINGESFGETVGQNIRTTVSNSDIAGWASTDGTVQTPPGNYPSACSDVGEFMYICCALSETCLFSYIYYLKQVYILKIYFMVKCCLGLKKTACQRNT